MELGPFKSNMPHASRLDCAISLFGDWIVPSAYLFKKIIEIITNSGFVLHITVFIDLPNEVNTFYAYLH